MLKRRLRAVNMVALDARRIVTATLSPRPNAPGKAAALLTRIARGNDLRHRIKQRISRLAKGGLVEQKSYYS